MSAPSVLELVAQMRQGAVSRNRNFDAFAGADAAQARRLWRYLRSLESQLRAAGPGKGVQVSVARSGEGTRITIEVAEIRSRRIAVLSNDEYALLAADDELRAVLEAGAEEASPAARRVG